MIADGKGFTLYWFAPDTPARSNCTGTCAQYWPPVTGRPTAGPGVTGTLGTITRSDGSTQATYDGHPLYTYIGDSAPGQANGNNLNLNGGLSHGCHGVWLTRLPGRSGATNSSRDSRPLERYRRRRPARVSGPPAHNSS